MEKKKQHILGIVPVEEEGVDSSIEEYVAVETELKTIFYSPHICVFTPQIYI